jgi:hypothetical protein
VTDVDSFPELRDCEFVLHDIDAKRLETGGALDVPTRISESLDRRAAVSSLGIATGWPRSVSRSFSKSAWARRVAGHRRLVATIDTNLPL